MKPLYLTSLVTVATLTVTPSYAEEVHLEHQIMAIFKDCRKGSDPDLNSRMEKLTHLADRWGATLNEKDMHKNIYEKTLEGQVFTLLIPYRDSTPLSGLAKSCWVQYEDWRRSYKNKFYDDTEYLQWRRCLTAVVYPSPKLTLLELIDSCQ